MTTTDPAGRELRGLSTAVGASAVGFSAAYIVSDLHRVHRNILYSLVAATTELQDPVRTVAAAIRASAFIGTGLATMRLRSPRSAG